MLLLIFQVFQSQTKTEIILEKFISPKNSSKFSQTYQSASNELQIGGRKKIDDWCRTCPNHHGIWICLHCPLHVGLKEMSKENNKFFYNAQSRNLFFVSRILFNVFSYVFFPVLLILNVALSEPVAIKSLVF
jgi:hypothetical protein